MDPQNLTSGGKAGVDGVKFPNRLLKLRGRHLTCGGEAATSRSNHPTSWNLLDFF